MTVMAAEAAAPAASAESAGAAGGAGAAAYDPYTRPEGLGYDVGFNEGLRRGGGGQPSKGGPTKGVLLAIAIVLLWLAGLAFFIALEGSKLLGEQANPDGAGFMKALIDGLSRVVQKQAAASG